MQLKCRGYGGRVLCVCLMSYTALHGFSTFWLYLERRSVSNSMGLGCSTPWCNVCIWLANISGMPMPAPGLTRWVTSAAHLLAFVREATWSHSFSCSWFGVTLLAGLQVACVSTSISLSADLQGEPPWLDVLRFGHSHYQMPIV